MLSLNRHHRQRSYFLLFLLVSAFPTSVTTCLDCCFHWKLIPEPSYFHHMPSGGPAVPNHFNVGIDNVWQMVRMICLLWCMFGTLWFQLRRAWQIPRWQLAGGRGGSIQWGFRSLCLSAFRRSRHHVWVGGSSKGEPARGHFCSRGVNKCRRHCRWWTKIKISNHHRRGVFLILLRSLVSGDGSGATVDGGWVVQDDPPILVRCKQCSKKGENTIILLIVFAIGICVYGQGWRWGIKHNPYIGYFPTPGLRSLVSSIFLLP